MRKNFVATIKWGSCEGSPNMEDLPAQFLQAKNMWEIKSQAAFGLLEPFLRCVFIPSNIISDVSEIIDMDSDVESTEISISGLDFYEKNLPSVSAIAIFELECREPFDKAKLDEWEKVNEALDNAINFQWNIPIELEFDPSLKNHQGSSLSFK